MLWKSRNNFAYVFFSMNPWHIFIYDMLWWYMKLHIIEAHCRGSICQNGSACQSNCRFELGLTTQPAPKALLNSAPFVYVISKMNQDLGFASPALWSLEVFQATPISEVFLFWKCWVICYLIINIEMGHDPVKHGFSMIFMFQIQRIMLLYSYRRVVFVFVGRHLICPS